jgi:hypothetical protein
MTQIHTGPYVTDTFGQHEVIRRDAQGQPVFTCTPDECAACESEATKAKRQVASRARTSLVDRP